MDLLDLELDLNGEGTSSPGRASRRSRGNAAAAPTVPTPKSQAKKSKAAEKKETATPATPKATATPKTAPKKTPAAKTAEVATPVVKKTPARKTSAKKAEPVEEPEEAEHEGSVEIDAEASASTSQEDRGRSTSLDKRSRHKAKKRFSPSPVAKKRKSMAVATPTTTVAPKKKKTALDPQEEFNDSIRRLREVVYSQEPQAFDIPEEWKELANEEGPAPTTTTPVQTPKTGKKSNAGTSKKEQQAATTRGRMSTSTAPAPEDVSPPAKSAPKEDRRRSKKVKEEQRDEMEEEPAAPEEPVAIINKRKSSVGARRKSIPAREVKKEEESDDDDEPPVVNPDSALVVKKRLMGEAKVSPKKKVKKAVKEEVSEEADDAPGPAPPAPAAPVSSVPTPKPKKEKAAPPAPAPAPVVPPTRASGRVSKPNRLYNDSSFNTEFLGRTRVTEQNPVKEAHAKEATPEPQELPPSRRKSTASAVPRPAPAPKPIPVHNGVQKGYIPSKKVPLGDYEVDGVVVKLNEEVNDVVDVLMLKVCKDGVFKHEDIDPKVVRNKTKVKVDSAKRVRLETKKLNIAMNSSSNTPSTSDELGKRKRQAPKSIDDVYWTPTAQNRKAPKSREATPFDEDYEPEGEDNRRLQKARRSISHILDEEMDASIKEAKSFSVRFDAYIKPKIAAAQKTAKIKLMSRKRQSADPDDFFYHEMLTDQVSPSTSNVENEGEEAEIDVMGVEEEPEAEITEEMSILIRTEALDTAEQIVVIVPRQTTHDGTPMPLEHLHTKAMEHLESRKLCLNETLPIVISQFTHESTPSSRSPQEAGCMWHTVTTANAQELKNLFAMTDHVREDAICWTHLFLLENLPVNYLASYLSVLRYAKRTLQDPIRMGYIINSTKDEEADTEWVHITSIVKAFAHKKFVEPGTEVLKNTIPVRRFENTVFLLVPPTLTSGDQRHHHRQQYGRIFRWLQSIGHPDSETITCTDEIDSACSVAEFLTDVVVEKICETVRRKRADKPNCKVVLVGYGSSTYMVHRAVNLVGGVSAIISIGFPVMSPIGRRGTAEDEILLTYCPTLFIVGAQGQRFNNQAMTELRTSMCSPSGLVILGYANDLLMVPNVVLLRLGISQTVVYRMILEKILDFLNLPAIRDHHNVSDLVPMKLHDIHELDQSLLKGDRGLSGLAFVSTPSSPLASPIPSSGRRATVSGAEETMVKKKREPANHPLLSTSSSLGGSMTPSPRSGDSFLAFQNLMISTTTTADDIPPRRSSVGASPRVVERGDFRDHRAARPSTSSGPSPKGGPVDPASISLS